MMKMDRVSIKTELRSLSRLRERVGVRVLPRWGCRCGESPHPLRQLRSDLSRKRER
jgi:hypothetical protein